MERFIRWKFSERKVIPFSRFTETTEISCTICLDYQCQDQSREKAKIYRYIVNGKTQSRSCFRCPQKITSTICRKFFTEISLQMISAPLNNK